jgi:hypothetical protein
MVSLVNDNLGVSLDDADAWGRLLSTTATAWSAGTYAYGSYVSSGGHSYVNTNPDGTTDTPGVGSDWVQVDTLTDMGGWNAEATYSAGQYVQDVLPLLLHRSITRTDLLSILEVKQVCISNCDGDERCITVLDDQAGPCDQPGSGSGGADGPPCGPCETTQTHYCVAFPGLTSSVSGNESVATTIAGGVTLTLNDPEDVADIFLNLADSDCLNAWCRTLLLGVPHGSTGAVTFGLYYHDSTWILACVNGTLFTTINGYTASDWDCNSPLTMTRTLDASGLGGFFEHWPDEITLVPGDCAATPVVYFDSDDICEDTASVTIHGSGFLPTGNTVTFTPSGTTGTITYVNSHELSVAITGQAVGALYAVVSNANGSSGSAVQVATVEPAPSITSSSDVTQATGLFTFAGTGFVPGGTSVSFSSGTWDPPTVSPTSITVNFTVAPDLGALNATVTTACGTDTQEVANIVSAGTVTLVGHWPLNETSGTTAHDSTVSANDLTISSAPWDADTPGSQAGSGGCAALTPGNNFTRLGDTGLPHGSSNVSVSFWFKVSSSAVAFQYGSTGLATFNRGTTTSTTWADDAGHLINGAGGTPDGNWHLYTMTWNGGNQWKYYEDGSLVHSGTAGFTLNTGSGNIGISAVFATSRIKDLRVYSGVLTPTQIADIFAGSPP